MPDLSSAAPRPYRRPSRSVGRERVGRPSPRAARAGRRSGRRAGRSARGRGSRRARVGASPGTSTIERRRAGVAQQLGRPAPPPRRAARAGSPRTRSTGSRRAARGRTGCAFAVDVHRRATAYARPLGVRHNRRVTDVLEGAHIAGCRIEAVAGRGGMGIVYRATQLSLGRPGRAEADRARARRRRRLPRALPARVADGGGDRSPERDPGLRGGRGGRPALPRDALGGGHRPAPAAARRGPARPAAGGGDRQPGRGRARRRARRRADPPRRQARQRPAQRRARLPGRLRADALRGRRHAPDDRRATSSARSTTWRPSSSTPAPTTRARTSTRSAACCSPR